MSNQNATLNAPSVSLDTWDYLARVEVCASRKVGKDGLTAKALDLNRGKLLSSCLADLRNYFPEVFPKDEKTGRPLPLPEPYYSKVVESVDLFLERCLKEFANADPNERGTMKQRYVHKSRGDNRGVILRTTWEKNELIDLETQIKKIDLFINKTIAQIDAMETDKEQILVGSPKEKRYLAAKKRLEKERETKAILEVRKQNLGEVATP